MAREILSDQVVQSIVIEKFRAAFLVRMGRGEFAGFTGNADIRRHVDYLSDQMVYMMESFCLKGQTISVAKVVDFECKTEAFATWWDHLKHDLKTLAWMPEWIRRRIVITKTATTQRHSKIVVMDTEIRVCPHHMKPLDKTDDHFRFLLPLRFDEHTVKEFHQ